MVSYKITIQLDFRRFHFFKRTWLWVDKYLKVYHSREQLYCNALCNFHITLLYCSAQTEEDKSQQKHFYLLSLHLGERSNISGSPKLSIGGVAERKFHVLERSLKRTRISRYSSNVSIRVSWNPVSRFIDISMYRPSPSIMLWNLVLTSPLILYMIGS